ncbi:cytidine deaminase [Mycoplasma sp. 3341]|uniref:cytidine deaminase n=1 Tax=Mycoplasma sp. 3341 TaxID=3447506 RepID=UPI003F65519A
MKIDLQKLRQNLDKAYAPYSKFHVSALAIDENDNQYWGVNCENIAFPSGLCAERSALFSAPVQGGKVGTFKEIHIISSSEKPVFPCAGCRQVMCEFMKPDSLVYCYSNDTKEVMKFKLEELVPNAIWPTTIKVG